MSENKDESLKVVIENKMNKGDVFTKLIMLAVIVVLIITNWTSCEKRKDDKQKYIQNTEAMKKEIKVEANKTIKTCWGQMLKNQLLQQCKGCLPVLAVFARIDGSTTPHCTQPHCRFEHLP